MRQMGLRGVVRGKETRTTIAGKAPCPADRVSPACAGTAELLNSLRSLGVLAGWEIWNQTKAALSEAGSSAVNGNLNLTHNPRRFAPRP